MSPFQILKDDGVDYEAIKRLAIIKSKEQTKFILDFLNQEILKTEGNKRYNEALRTVRAEFVGRY